MSTQWAAQFLVAAELERHGYAVTFTMGHATPVADLMVGHATGNQFWVDVKGLASNNAWWGRTQTKRKNLFYVLVRIGETRSTDRFFILSQREWNDLIVRYEKDHPKQKKVGGFNWGAPLKYENQWRKLPRWPGNSN